jgi:hypothetical protein
MTVQGLQQQAVRDQTSTTHPYNGDWLALFAAQGVTVGTFNERLLTWINAELGATYTNVAEAEAAFIASTCGESSILPATALTLGSQPLELGGEPLTLGA